LVEVLEKVGSSYLQTQQNESFHQTAVTLAAEVESLVAASNSNNHPYNVHTIHN
jgi:hypothetical protein